MIGTMASFLHISPKMIIIGNTLITTQIIGDLSKKKMSATQLRFGRRYLCEPCYIKYELRQLEMSVLDSHFKLY